MARKVMSESALKAAREKRFWSRVERGGAGDCWIWLGPINRSGYGLFGLWSNADRGKVKTAHRYAYELTHGEIPRGSGKHGTVIAHKCDVRRCVNPAHLFACTQAENLRDCLDKGRGNKASGERSGRAKLSESAVTAIRALIKEGVDRQKISRAFGIVPQSVKDIADGKTWQEITNGEAIPLSDAPKDYSWCKPNSGSFKKGSKGNPGPKPELRTIDYSEARRLYGEGKSIRAVARLMGTTHTTVRRAVAN